MYRGMTTAILYDPLLQILIALRSFLPFSKKNLLARSPAWRIEILKLEIRTVFLLNLNFIEVEVRIFHGFFVSIVRI
jgi:hypothetical protein